MRETTAPVLLIYTKGKAPGAEHLLSKYLPPQGVTWLGTHDCPPRPLCAAVMGFNDGFP